ncbi:hypothetical protein DPMN_164818 [Dreissena polymorpha]|uniref:Uncharacterized protein n=1 Tax=Dreissena polymorpha TaxID=45954 RepID=A0A9D4IVS8_DREPO|nr:hypothetical protein DPMN_164818 [Dreissena polymorpha]
MRQNNYIIEAEFVKLIREWLRLKTHRVFRQKKDVHGVSGSVIIFFKALTVAPFLP